MKLRRVTVTVQFESAHAVLAKGEIEIPITDSANLKVGTLVDACQRGVANCIEVLEKQLDSTR